MVDPGQTERPYPPFRGLATFGRLRALRAVFRMLMDRGDVGVTPGAMWPGIADVIWHGAGARDAGGGTHVDPSSRCVGWGIAERSACTSVARAR